ncbi:MAG: N(4)-(beta-N-acetylglucosaminyl)-L-asparaginase [Acidobacteriota bacterium]
MGSTVTRRQFVQTSTAGFAAAATMPVFGEAPAIQTGAVKPVVVGSSNGNRFKNGGPVTGVQKAFEMMTKGSDVLDSLIAGVNLCELDPEDSGVGYGGLPNADGVVQLDSCCMHGPTRRAGGVACLEGVRTPSLVAKAVLEHTDHHLLVGKDAQAFARNMGFKIEEDLNTERSRQLWLEWKRRIDPQHYLDPKKRGEIAMAAGLSMVRDGLIDPMSYFGTINMDGVNAKGEVCGVTTTSGLAWKIPGRVGDSPILGAGLYVDGEVGAAGSTGRGEANLYNLCSYLIVEEMRRGRHPKDAGLEALKRVQKNTVEKRLLNSRGLPNFGLSFYILNAKGEYAGVSMYAGNYAVCTEKGPETAPMTALLEGRSTD